ncbi:MAG: hypothetical protein ACPL7K_02540 [Armatimonadota bacterium]
MGTDLTNNRRAPGSWVRLGEAIAVLVAVPFLVGGIALWLRLAQLPTAARGLATAPVLGSAAFASGIGLGIIGATFALTAQSVSKRVLCTALTLFALAYAVLGFYVRHACVGTNAVSAATLLVIVVALVVWSVALAFSVLRAPVPHEPDSSGENVNEERPQVQSPP